MLSSTKAMVACVQELKNAGTTGFSEPVSIYQFQSFISKADGKSKGGVALLVHDSFHCQTHENDTRLAESLSALGAELAITSIYCQDLGWISIGSIYLHPTLLTSSNLKKIWKLIDQHERPFILGGDLNSPGHSIDRKSKRLNSSHG